MARVSRKVHDRVLLKLIGRYLRAGVMVDGILQPSTEGTMQGGPLSPLLANILLDDFDKVLERRGLRFVRYADDFLIFVKSECSARRVFRSVERYLTGTLKLVVNHDKSRVCRTAGVEFLGYQFHGFGGQIRVRPKSLKKFKQRAKAILTRNRGISMRRRFRELRLYLRGWIDYFVLEQRKSLTLTLDKCPNPTHSGRRVRACYWSNWRLPRTRLKKLQALGGSYDEAYPPAHSGKGPWRLSTTSGVHRALSNAWLQSQGLFTLEERWSALAPKRRTALC
ncbi:Group II intron-encoded protein LtrA [Stieleria neptunia]|uniref:Group II intron-encoded protein LtrA n=2 Tax=Stieleria neptunia TaxID=2527979 RepID=A0A518HK64_9BACT|nr:Group II intron-encoded protein LtrA [Stieleria neptunia]